MVVLNSKVILINDQYWLRKKENTVLLKWQNCHWPYRYIMESFMCMTLLYHSGSGTAPGDGARDAPKAHPTWGAWCSHVTGVAGVPAVLQSPNDRSLLSSLHSGIKFSLQMGLLHMCSLHNSKNHFTLNHLTTFQPEIRQFLPDHAIGIC